MKNVMKEMVRKFWVIALLALCITVPSTNISVYAASNNKPYGYTYDDAALYRTVYKFYKYNVEKKTYTVGREMYSKGNYIYRSNGILVSNEAAGSGARYAGFDATGNFFFITKSATLVKLDTANKSTTISKIKDALKLNYNSDDICYSVSTKTGNFYLSNLSPAPTTDDDNTPVPTPAKSKNRVEIYSNARGEIVTDAYCNNKLKTRIITSRNEHNVLNATANVRLTDSLKGSKFIGFDTSYNVYLSEGSTLYRFKTGKWYSAQKMPLNGTYKSFKRDTNGFISNIVTSKGSYTIRQLSATGNWTAKKTYAVTKGTYTTLYTKGSSKTHTLRLSSGKLSLDGKLIASNVKKFGFVNSKKLVYIKSNKISYYATISKPKTAKKLYSASKSFKFSSSNGLTTHVVTTKGTKKIK